MKVMFLTLMLLVTNYAMALETSLVMRSPGGGGGIYAVVQPATGAITLYGFEGNSTTKYGSANFIADLELLSSFPAAKQAGIYYSRLRLSDLASTPTPGDLLRSPAFPEKPSKREAEAGIKALRYRAIEAEDAFWAEEKPYDGIVRGAMGTQYLLICIPIKHAILMYDCQDRNKGPQLISWRNYGVDLMIPQVFNSDPAPEDILKALPPDIKEEQKKSLAEQLEVMAQGGGSLKLQPSDPWIASGSGDRWVMVDPPNKRILTYEYRGKTWELKSARNLEIDQLIPSSMNSSPDEQRTFEEYANSRKKQLAEMGIIIDMPYLKALVNQKQVASEKTSDIQANIVGDDLMLDFVKLRKIYAYRLNGARNGLEFVSMRDYTLDTGLSLQDVELRQDAYAQDAWASAKKILAKHDDDLGWRVVKFALKLNPLMYRVIEKDPAVKSLKKQADWQPTLDEAIKAGEEKAKKIEERRKAAEEERKKNKK
jgi:hypothetical protein